MKTPNYLNGYRLAIENAKKHFEIAELIVKNGISFGIANSHLILASEETVKAGMLFSLHHDPEMKVDDFDEYFSNHKHKHKTIISIEFMFSFMDDIIKMVSKPARDRYNAKGGYLNAEEYKKSMDEGIENLITHLDKILIGVNGIKTNEEWWQQANAKKNLGFYVHLNKSSLKWETPATVSEVEYQNVKKIVENLMKDFVSLEEIFSQKEVQDAYAKFKEQERIRKKR